MDTIKSGVQAVVNELYQQHGEVKPSELVEAARPKDSPAHEGFEWDNKKAGQEYRLLQARQWIRRVEIIVEDRAERMVHIPQVVIEGEQTEGAEGRYKPMSVVVSNQSDYQAAMQSTLAKLNAAKAAFEELKGAAAKSKIKKAPNFRKADKGFSMVETALAANG